MGPAKDGGYVMIEPGRNGIAYSFGISHNAPWDMEMAKRGFRVYQYDGTIRRPPEKHPKLVFTKANISGQPNPGKDEKNLEQILRDHSHQNEKNIILQIDIEGAEWDFFEHLSDAQLLQFSQFIVEFHGLFDASQFERYLSVLEKICRTHAPVHFHLNNCGSYMVFPHFLATEAIEVSFLRRDQYIFQTSTETYPISLDAPCSVNLPDIPIGNFSRITDDFSQFLNDDDRLNVTDFLQKSLAWQRAEVQRLRSPWRRVWRHIRQGRF